MFQNHWYLGKGKKLELVSIHTNQMETRPFPVQLLAQLLILNSATFSQKLHLALGVDKAIWYHQLTQVHHSRLMLVV